MCGLIGATGKLEARYLIALGCLAERRGGDSAGVGWQVGERLRIAKVAQNPLVAYPVTLAPAIRHAAKYGGCLIGHTRQATTGKVTGPNAHPFLDAEAKIAWAHNGIISNYRQFGEFEVDSQSLIQGIKNRDFSPYYGPVALLWIEGGKLHAFRKGNPLYRGIRKQAVYLASEQDMLAQIGCRKIKELSEGRLYVWDAMKLESVKSIASNKVFAPYTRSPMYAGDDGWEGWKAGTVGRYDELQKKWVYEKHETGGSGHRPAGFRAYRGPDETRDLAATQSEAATTQDDLLLPNEIRDDGVLTEKELEELGPLCSECREIPRMTSRPYCYKCYGEIIKANMGTGD